MKVPLSPVILALSITDAAASIGLSVRTISSMIADGRLGSIKIGKRRLVTIEQLEKLIAVGTALVEEGHNQTKRPL